MEAFLAELCQLSTGQVVEAEVLADETVVEYLEAASGISQEPTGAAEGLGFDDFVEVVRGFLPSLELSDEGTRQARLRYDALVACGRERSQSAGSASTAGTSTSGSGPASSSLQVESVAAASLGQRQVGPRPAFPGAAEAAEEPSSAIAPPAVQAADARVNPKMEQLRAVLPPGGSEAAAQFVLEHHCNNEVDRAAMLVLDNGMAHIEELYQAHLALEAKRAADLAKQQAEEALRVKQLLMSRFDEVEVMEGSQKSRAAAAKETRKAARRQQKQERKAKQDNQVRYLDGQIVSRKGERFTVISSGAPEWNGGSKGRVITKGKRGPGWVSG